MKKTILTLACVITLVANAKADAYQPITLSQLPAKAQTFLSTHFPNSKTSLVRKELDGVKILGNGELTKTLTVKATVFSATAKEKIEAAGGKIEEV